MSAQPCWFLWKVWVKTLKKEKNSVFAQMCLKCMSCHTVYSHKDPKMWWLWYNRVLPYLHTLTHTQSWTGRGWVLRFLCCIPHSRLMPWCETFPISCSSQVSVWLETNVFTGKLKISYIHLLSSSYFQCFSTDFLYSKDRYVGIFFFFCKFAANLQIKLGI